MGAAEAEARLGQEEGAQVDPQVPGQRGGWADPCRHQLRSPKGLLPPAFRGSLQLFSLDSHLLLLLCAAGGDIFGAEGLRWQRGHVQPRGGPAAGGPGGIGGCGQRSSRGVSRELGGGGDDGEFGDEGLGLGKPNTSRSKAVSAGPGRSTRCQICGTRGAGSCEGRQRRVCCWSEWGGGLPNLSPGQEPFGDSQQLGPRPWG